jgi:hypothetical protein
MQAIVYNNYKYLLDVTSLSLFSFLQCPTVYLRDDIISRWGISQEESYVESIGDPLW